MDIESKIRQFEMDQFEKYLDNHLDTFLSDPTNVNQIDKLCKEALNKFNQKENKEQLVSKFAELMAEEIDGDFMQAEMLRGVIHGEVSEKQYEKYKNSRKCGKK